MASEEMDRIVAHLKRLGLPHAAQNLDEHLQQAAQLKLSGLGLIARIAEAEVLARNERAAGLRITQAEFPEVCRLENYDFKKQPCLNRSQVLELGELAFVDKKQPVLWIGPSGVGKTHLAIALGVRACQAGYRVRFFRAYHLLTRLYASLADDTLEFVLEELCSPTSLSWTSWATARASASTTSPGSSSSWSRGGIDAEPSSSPQILASMNGPVLWGRPRR